MRGCMDNHCPLKFIVDGIRLASGRDMVPPIALAFDISYIFG